MFDETSVFLEILGQFLTIGLFLGVFYDIISFFRIVFGSGKVSYFISDFLFVIFSALIVIYFSLELTAGEIRLYYFLAAGVGVAFYVFTVGFITRFLAKIFSKFFKRIYYFLKKSVLKQLYTFLLSKCRKISLMFVNVYRKISKKVEKPHFHLQKKHNIMYNNKIGKLCANGGEERNVIKAKVRKKV